MKISHENSRGVTLIEIIIVVSILIVIISFGMTIDLSTFKRDTFLEEQSKIVSILERARSRAMANVFESKHGVCYNTDSYVIFHDGSCDKSDEDEVIPANTDIATNPRTIFPSSVIFDRLTGNTSPVTIHITDGTKSSDITINSKGAINW